MIFSHLFSVLDEKEASEKMACREGLANKANNSVVPSSSAPRTPESSNSLQAVHQLKNHLARSHPLVTEIPPRTRIHKQIIQKTRNKDGRCTALFSSKPSCCKDVPRCPTSPRVLPPIRSSGSSPTKSNKSLSEGVISDNIVSGPGLRKLPPLENEFPTKKRSEKARWETFTGNVAFAEGRENEAGSFQNEAKLFGSRPAAINDWHDNLDHRRMSQPGCLHGTSERKTPGASDNPRVTYYPNESQGLCADSARRVSLATQTVRERRQKVEEFWQRETQNQRRDFPSVHGGKATDKREEVERNNLERKRGESLRLPAHGAHYELNRIEFLRSSTKCTDENQSSCKFSANTTDMELENSSTPAAMEALYVNLIASENRRRNATCDVLEQNADDHLFEMRQILANSFA